MKLQFRPVAIYVLVALVIMGGIALWDRASRPVAVPAAGGVAVRARAAAQSITGEPTVRRVIDDQVGQVTVQARSKYYSSKASADDNREYLATEGRLIVQLILHDIPEILVARVELYGGRQRLATVEGGPAQKYEEYRVTYDGPLAR